MKPVTMGPRMEELAAIPLVMPISSPAKLGERSRGLAMTPVYTPPSSVTEMVSRATAAVALSISDIATSAAAPPHSAGNKHAVALTPNV